MTFVTDTHPFVHHVTGRRNRLGRRALRVFDSAKRGRDTLLVPFTVLEEVMLLSEIGRIRLPLPFRDFVISIGQAEKFRFGRKRPGSSSRSFNIHGHQGSVRPPDHRPG